MISASVSRIARLFHCHPEQVLRPAKSTGSQHRRSARLHGAAAAVLIVPASLLAPQMASSQELNSFAVVSGQSLTNTGPTTITGNIAVSPGNSYTGSGSVTLTGAEYIGDAVAARMQADLTTLYNVLAGRPATVTLINPELGGLTLTPGVYDMETAQISGGTLTLDAAGDPNAVFIFNIDSTFITGNGASVLLQGQAQGGNVFYRVGSSATLDTATNLFGQIVALTSISLNTGANIPCGAALARNGSITLDTNTIGICVLAAGSFEDALDDEDGGDDETTPTGNAQSIADALDDFITAGGVLPASFSILAASLTSAELANALSQLSGEVATGVAPTAMRSTDGFLDTMIGRRHSGGAPAPSDQAPQSSTISVLGYGPQAVSAAFSAFPTIQSPRSWNAWTAGFGGRSSTEGSTTMGSQERESDNVGIAFGLDRFLDPDTTIGISVSTSRSEFNLRGGLDGGRTDTVHAGVYARTEHDAMYVVGALAYGYSDASTDRTVDFAGEDRFAAKFAAHTVAGHVEAGYNLGIITPFAALRGQAFMTPAYSEDTIAGVSTYALEYGEQTTTSLRTELGVNVEWSTIMSAGYVLDLRARGAWAYEHSLDGTVQASFQSIPGADFEVGGANADRNALLVSAGAEVSRDGAYLAGSVNGSLSANAHAYGGAVKVGYVW